MVINCCILMNFIKFLMLCDATINANIVVAVVVDVDGVFIVKTMYTLWLLEFHYKICWSTNVYLCENISI